MPFPKPEYKKIEGVLRFDGDCKPNPGNARCAYVLHIGDSRMEKIIDLGHGTNNIAEYEGLIHGMRAAAGLGVTDLEVYGDSLLVINGAKRGKFNSGGKPHIEALKRRVFQIAANFKRVDYHWVPREENTDADSLLNPQDYLDTP